MELLVNHNVIHIFPETTILFQSAADDFIRRAIATVHKKQLFTVVLAGGETPELFFDTLVTTAHTVPDIPWRQIKFFFGDERYVAADDPASNYHMAQEHLFSKLPIPAENIYRIPTELADPHIAAEQYAQTLRDVFKTKQNELPQFDLVYLGLGSNAHTASLMPGNDVVRAYIDAGHHTQQLVAAAWIAELNMYRITLMPPLLNNSESICFLAAGANKALAVWEILKGPLQPLQYPAQLIECVHEKTVWYLDDAAAAKLKP